MVFSFYPDNTDMCTKQTNFKAKFQSKLMNHLGARFWWIFYVFIKTVALASRQAQAQICAEV